MNYTFLGKEISGYFTIPSGVITTQKSVIEKIGREIPEIGVITTKSIGLQPREGYREPILTQYAPGGFMNAVGLTNPGVVEFANQLQMLKLPEKRFLLISIFGSSVEEFVKVATLLSPYPDGLELNLSCPNARGYGMAIGQDPELVYHITKAVKEAVTIPVIPKLTPNTTNIAEIAKAAVRGGADAICAINTVGPGSYEIDGHPVLTNRYGGMSGKGIRPIGLKCVREIANAVDVPIIGCGGISNAEDVRAYQQAGATIIGIGTTLVGLRSKEVHTFFSTLRHDLDHRSNSAPMITKTADMSFTKSRVVENRRLADDLSLLIFDREIDIRPGQFVFIWLPEIGEKPFSVLDDQPLTLAIKQRGDFTKKLCQLERGDSVYFRGPYGVPVSIPKQKDIILTCGGSGLAAAYPVAKRSHYPTMFIGAKDAHHLFYLDKAQQIADVYVTTEDGSLGQQGLMTERLAQYLQQTQPQGEPIFFNCGPEMMIETAVSIEQQYTSQENIYNSLDYITKCGVGLCGSCATHDGRRSCVDGPFLHQS